jgi:hypothetical protein
MTPADTLAPWHDFCPLSGTASATFVALLFVAASVGSGIWERPEALRVFLTATVHFSSVLLVNLIVVAPLHSELISRLLIGSAALKKRGLDMLLPGCGELDRPLDPTFAVTCPILVASTRGAHR